MFLGSEHIGIIRLVEYVQTSTKFIYLFIYFYLHIYPPDSQESAGGAIHKVSTYPELLPEMLIYCCPLEILIEV